MIPNQSLGSFKALHSTNKRFLTSVEVVPCQDQQLQPFPRGTVCLLPFEWKQNSVCSLVLCCVVTGINLPSFSELIQAGVLFFPFCWIPAMYVGPHASKEVFSADFITYFKVIQNKRLHFPPTNIAQIHLGYSNGEKTVDLSSRPRLFKGCITLSSGKVLAKQTTLSTGYCYPPFEQLEPEWFFFGRRNNFSLYISFSLWRSQSVGFKPLKTCHKALFLLSSTLVDVG